MSQSKNMAALTELSQLILDRQLARLRDARRAQQVTRGQIAGLAADAAGEGLSDIMAQQVALRYQAWADARRRDLNLILAQQTAEMLGCQDDARLAFGRDAALRNLKQRQC